MHTQREKKSGRAEGTNVLHLKRSTFLQNVHCAHLDQNILVNQYTIITVLIYLITYVFATRLE
jgi:hypothetical protein